MDGWMDRKEVNNQCLKFKQGLMRMFGDAIVMIDV